MKSKRSDLREVVMTRMLRWHFDQCIEIEQLTCAEPRTKAWYDNNVLKEDCEYRLRDDPLYSCGWVAVLPPRDERHLQVLALLLYRPISEGVQEIDRLLVHPSCQRRGVGSKLLRQWVSTRTRDAEIKYRVDNDDFETMAFLVANGFSKSYTETSYSSRETCFALQPFCRPYYF